MSKYPPEITQRFHASPEQLGAGLVGESPDRWRSHVIADPDPAWAHRYAEAEAGLRVVLGDAIVSCEHVGSTSVPGLAAKPVIDIDLTVDDTSDEPAYVPALAALGYRLVLREPWWQGHRMLVGADADVHLHVWPPGAPEPVRHKLFRDWLRTHEEDRDRYAEAKRRIARETVAAPGDYSLTKNDVIDDIFARIFAD